MKSSGNKNEISHNCTRHYTRWPAGKCLIFIIKVVPTSPIKNIHTLCGNSTSSPIFSDAFLTRTERLTRIVESEGITTSGTATVLSICSSLAVLPRVDQIGRMEVEGETSGIVRVEVASTKGKELGVWEMSMSEPRETGIGSEAWIAKGILELSNFAIKSP